MNAVKKAVSGGKTGESAFRPDKEGAYFNAFPSGIETLKQLEDAITACGVNGSDSIRPNTSEGAASNPDKPATNESKDRPNNDSSITETGMAQVSQDWALRKAFRIGINFDADALYNKDPKEPNKYEVEGMKGQLSNANLVDWYVKLCTDHPLITYLEDPMANDDYDGMRKLKDALVEKNPSVQIGMRSKFV